MNGECRMLVEVDENLIKKVKEYYSEDEKCDVVDYNINVKDSLEKYKDQYEPYISERRVR